MSLALAIETSNPSAECGAGVAFGDMTDGGLKALGIEPVSRADRHSDDLLPAIDRLARRIGVQASELSRICVSVGPGGYTGLRIAVVVAQSIAEVSGATCTGVPTELVVARRVGGTGSFAVCLASKGDTVYARAFDAPDQPRGEGRVLAASAVHELEVDRIVADRFLPEGAKGDWAGRLIAPTFDPIAVLEASVSLPELDPARLGVIYRREPDAVTQWRRLHGGA